MELPGEDPVGYLLQVILRQLVLIDESLRSHERILSVVVSQPQRLQASGCLYLHWQHMVIELRPHKTYPNTDTQTQSHTYHANKYAWTEGQHLHRRSL